MIRFYSFKKNMRFTDANLSDIELHAVPVLVSLPMSL